MGVSGRTQAGLGVTQHKHSRCPGPPLWMPWTVGMFWKGLPCRPNSSHLPVLPSQGLGALSTHREDFHP